MGYTTEFEGAFKLDRELTRKEEKYLRAFAEIRHMKRDSAKAVKLDDPIRAAVGLPIGVEAEYFVGNSGDGDYGQAHTDDILDYNSEPKTQPGLWCKWEPTEDADGIQWDGAEKFYDYVEWLRYLITNFLAPWGYTLNGEVEYWGEDPSDFGKIIVKDNVVTQKVGRKVFG